MQWCIYPRFTHKEVMIYDGRVVFRKLDIFSR